MRTDRAKSAVLAPAATNINAAPIFGARFVAKELKNPQMLMRVAAVSGLPSAPT